MDNDKKIVKFIKQLIKNTKFRLNYRDLEILPEKAGNELLLSKLNNNTSFMACRAGATEMRCVEEYFKTGHFSEKIKREISELSGVFPVDEQFLERFCNYYILCMEKADIIALWGVGAESKIVHEYCNKAMFTTLHALEPYYFQCPWSKALEQKKVLVIHPFIDSIKLQYTKREKIYPGTEILPEFKNLQCVKAVQSFAGQKTAYNDWFEALDSMKSNISECDFDVAIIGAGAYGLPLAAYVKSLGKQAIQMSGATQILFGIKGKRWDDHPVISKFYNDAWVRPLQSETPPETQKVEGGSYW